MLLEGKWWHGIQGYVQMWGPWRLLTAQLLKFSPGPDLTDSHGTTIDHDLHRLRRKPMEPYFSRAGVSRIEPVLQSLVQAMVARLDELRGSGNIVRLDHVFSAFSGDVITAICIGNGEGASLRHPMFDPEWYVTSWS